MSTKTTILVVCCLLILSHTSKAEEAQDIINQQDWITRQQQNILEEKKRTAEFETIKKEHERLKKEEAQGAQQVVTGEMRTCVALQEIKLIDAKSLSSSLKKKITKPFLGRCLDAKLFTEIIKMVSDHYHANGYATVQVLAPKQNLQSGILELQIIEGKIETLSLGGDGLRERMQKFTAFGNIENKTLNVNDINQGIAQMNRLPSRQSAMKIEPGSADGLSKVVVTSSKKFPVRANVSRDNIGNHFTGMQRTTFSTSLDNLLSLNDGLSLSRTVNLHDDHNIKNSDAFSANFSVPFRYSTLSYDFSRSEYKGTNVLNNGIAVVKGFSQQSKVSLDHVWLNKVNLRLSSNVSLTAKTAASYQNNKKQENSERRLSILNLGGTASYYFNNTTSIYLKPSYVRGLKILNAEKNQPGAPKDELKPQYEALKLFASFSKRLVAPLSFVSEFDSQYSKQNLFGSEQFSIGGYYSVRGFLENNISTSSGYHLRNKLSFGLGAVSPYLNSITIEPFYDYGHAQDQYRHYSGRLSGAGLKGIFSHKYFNASVTYAEVLSKSQLLNTSRYRENQMLYFELSAGCC